MPSATLAPSVTHQSRTLPEVRCTSTRLQVETASNVVDGIADAITVLATTYGVAADAFAMNPTDLAIARKAKAEGSGSHLFDPQATEPNTLHGLPSRSTTQLAAGTVLVGSFKTGDAAYTRDQLRVTTGLNADDSGRTCRA